MAHLKAVAWVLYILNCLRLGESLLSVGGGGAWRARIFTNTEFSAATWALNFKRLKAKAYAGFKLRFCPLILLKLMDPRLTLTTVEFSVWAWDYTVSLVWALAGFYVEVLLMAPIQLLNMWDWPQLIEHVELTSAFFTVTVSSDGPWIWGNALFNTGIPTVQREECDCICE